MRGEEEGLTELRAFRPLARSPCPLTLTTNHKSFPVTRELKIGGKYSRAQALCSFTMNSKSKNCRICKENLLTKYGTHGASVPLFSETTSKEWATVLDGKQPVILAKVLENIGIVAVPTTNGDHNSVCKKCARKGFNCFKLYSELRYLLNTSNNPCSDNSFVATGTTEVEPATNIHERSPTGLTPKPKRTKPKQAGHCSKSADCKKSLFSEENSQKKTDPEVERQKLSTINDEIGSLMNIPPNMCGAGGHLPPIVKVISNIFGVLICTMRVSRLFVSFSLKKGICWLS